MKRTSQSSTNNSNSTSLFQGHAMTVTTESLFNEDDINSILHNCFKHDNFKVKSFLIKPFSDSVTGFLGDHFRLTVVATVNDEEIEKRFFVKSAPREPGTLQYDLTVKSGVFEREIDIYQCIFKDVEDMIEKQIMACDMIWFPKFYFEKDKQLIVLEDVGLKGYKPAPSKVPFDNEHVFVGLTALANMHASLFWYEEKAIKQTGKKNLLQMFPYLKKESLYADHSSSPFNEWFLTMIHSFASLADLVDGYSEKEKIIIKGKMTGIMAELQAYVKASKKYRNVLTHGDIWSNNLMYLYNDGKPIQATIVDFQIARYTPPVQDVLNFVHLVTTKQTRNDFMDDFIEHYYRKLIIYVRKYGLDIENCLPREEFEDSLKFYKRFAIINALQNLSYTLTPEFVANNAFCDDQKHREFIMSKRNYYIKECFKDELYRNRMSESFREVVETCINVDM